jgi:ArsR family transcriptional regulator
MSRQALPVFADSTCCTPIVAEALSDGEAADLARGFKALSDPVRLRLLSLIAARAGGEACVLISTAGAGCDHEVRNNRAAAAVATARTATSTSR